MPESESKIVEEYEIDHDLSKPSLTVRKKYSRFGWLLVINEGANKSGFKVCQYCGYADKETWDDKFKKKKQIHKNPFNGKDCPGKLNNFSLAHRFMTDVLEINFVRNNSLDSMRDELNLYRSVAYALIEGAVRDLSIRRTDLEGTVFVNEGHYSIIIYDTVPGGAGHVKRISDSLNNVFISALAHVSHDCCGEETSCSECLRNYNNQYYHPMLKRGLAKRFLTNIISN